MIDIINIILAIISLFIGIIGAIFTYKSYLKERALKNISWNDINNGTKYIWKMLHKHGFKPDIMISPDPKGGIVSHLLSQFFDYDIFIYTGHTTHKNTILGDLFTEEDYTVVNTNRWKVFYSKQIKYAPHKENTKILIVNDFVLSGDFNTQFLKFLTDCGYLRENIIICSIAVTKVAIKSGKAPDFYWKMVDDGDFYFPWGKAE